MNKKLLFTLIIIPMVSLAAAPPPPSIDDLSSSSACKEYAAQMVNYLQNERQNNLTNMLNIAWFSKFSESYSSSTYAEKCEKGNCIVEYDGNDSGCYIATVARSQPINQLLEILRIAYSSAMNTVKIADSGNYGFVGNKNVCTAMNHYQFCNLVSHNR